MLPRTLAPHLLKLAGPFPVIFLTGPRQSGKTTLARQTFPGFHYVNLEELQNRQEALEDPRGFLRRFERQAGVILDEAHRTPDLFSYLQTFVDERRGGPVVLTGSQQFLLTKSISQTLAGRAAVLHLLPFSVAELCTRPPLHPGDLANLLSAVPPEPYDLDTLLFSGMLPPIHDRSLPPAVWLDSYLRTYVERDVRTLGGVGDLDTFTRFLALCAGRSGQLLNLSSLGNEAGVSHATARRWISILQASYVLELLPPFHESFAKRVVKTPKLHFLDTGLLCRLLGIRASGELHTHPLRGAIFESFVLSELRKLFLHNGEHPPLYFWRDSNGLEVDVLIDLGATRLPIEIKSGETVTPSILRSLDRFRAISGLPSAVLVYGGAGHYQRGATLLRPWWLAT
jgi:uncharacterized protein